MDLSRFYLLTPLQISYKCNHTARNNVWNWKNFSQNWKMVKMFLSWDRNFVHPPPIFGRENLGKPSLWHTVRATSKLLMDPTSVIASDPQVWLLAIICCKIGIFRYLLFIVKFLKLFILWYFRCSLRVEYHTFEALRAT